MALRDAPKSGARVAGWESPDGKYHRVLNMSGTKIGRAPTDRQMEKARRVVIYDPKTDEFHTISKVTPRLDLDKVVDSIRDYYQEIRG